ncbi:MAG: prepilin-type N-terminal cleavage/methylation domain-containing protein [Pseudomonadota bacterium]
MPDMTIDKKEGPHPSGFTFLEVMIALSIIAIVLVGIYRLQSQTVLMSIRSRFDIIAPLLARQKLSELEMDPKSAKSDTGSFGDAFPGYDWQVSVTGITSEFLGQLSEDIKQINVRITFQEGENVYNLRTYRLIEAK